MEHGFARNLITFLLVLVLTVGTVSALSTATAAKTETAPRRYSQQVREIEAPTAAELSAPVPEDGSAPLESVGAFALILSISGGGVAMFLQARRKGWKNAASAGRRYNPRADRIFQATAGRTRV